MLEMLANWLGWKTLYHVSWTSPIATGGQMVGEMTLIVRPWITRANWEKARAVVAEYVRIDQSAITITSVTRL